MKSLRNIKNILFEVAQKLSQNKELLTLLLDDSNDLSGDVLDDENCKYQWLADNHYITYMAAVPTNLEEPFKNTFIVLDLTEGNFYDDGSVDAFVSILVTTDRDHLLLKNGKIRTLEAADLIISMLDGLKISSYGVVEVLRYNSVIVDEYRDGYQITIRIRDKVDSRKAEI